MPKSEENKGQVSLEKIQKAQRRIKPILNSTTAVASAAFSSEFGHEIYLKPENLQVTGSFKIRGAYNHIVQLSNEDKKRGLIAASAGNHAQGVAYGAYLAKVPALIIMPTTTPLIKIEATRQLGAEVLLHGQNYDDAYEEAVKRQREEGLVLIHPFDDEEVIAGQGTIGLEILEEVADVDCILVPVGGGGLIAGIASAVKAIKPKVQVVGVEPEGAASLKHSIEKGRVAALKGVDTIADGVAVKQPGKKTFEIAKNLVDEILVVKDQELMDAFLLLLEKHKLIAEPSGVLSLAAAKHKRGKKQKIVSVISGGNIDVMTISSVIQNGLVSRGRIFCFSLELPDLPGELLKVCRILAENNANIVQMVHDQFKASDSLKRVNLEATVETHGQSHRIRIIEELKRQGYQVRQIY